MIFLRKFCNISRFVFEVDDSFRILTFLKIALALTKSALLGLTATSRPTFKQYFLMISYAMTVLVTAIMTISFSILAKSLRLHEKLRFPTLFKITYIIQYLNMKCILVALAIIPHYKNSFHSPYSFTKCSHRDINFCDDNYVHCEVDDGKCAPIRYADRQFEDNGFWFVWIALLCSSVVLIYQNNECARYLDGVAHTNNTNPLFQRHGTSFDKQGILVCESLVVIGFITALVPKPPFHPNWKDDAQFPIYIFIIFTACINFIMYISLIWDSRRETPESLSIN